MHLVLGANGHTGSAVARALLDTGEAVTVVTRRPETSPGWQRHGARVAVVDIEDVNALRDVMTSATTLFALNPPAHPSGDTDAVEHRTAACIAEAVEGSTLERVVAISTYGAQPGARIGDLGTLFHLEELLRALPVPVTVLRSAFLLSNWDGALDAIRADGRLTSMMPPELVMPMVSPVDVGKIAARLLTETSASSAVVYAEGPERWSTLDVAAAFAQSLDHPVEVDATPPDDLVDAHRGRGFSSEAAESYAAMTALAVDDIAAGDLPSDPVRGPTTLQDHVDALVTRRSGTAATR